MKAFRLAAAAVLAAMAMAPAALAVDDGAYMEIFGGYLAGNSNTHAGTAVDLGAGASFGARFGYMMSERWGADVGLDFAMPDLEYAGASKRETLWFLDVGAVRKFAPDRSVDFLLPFGLTRGVISAGPESDSTFGLFAGAALRWHPGKSQWYFRADARGRVLPWELSGKKENYMTWEGTLSWGKAFGKP